MIKSQHKEFIIKDTKGLSCHASCILSLDEARTACAFTMGSKEGAKDYDVYTSVKENGKWSEPLRICADEHKAHWNPVLFKNQNGEIILYFKVGNKVPSWKTFFCTSLDGIEWSEPKELIKGDIGGGRGPAKNKPLILSDGRIIAPSSDERNNLFVCYADISDDEGLTWKRMKNIPTYSLFRLYVPMVQPALWQSNDGHVHMLTRTSRGKIYRSDSEDRGESWCKAYPTRVPNNNSGIDLCTHGDGRIFLLCNPVSNSKKRTPLYLMVSTDGGEKFIKLMCLEEREGEFSYPSVDIHKNILHISYTFNRENIVYRRIELNEKML